MTTQTDSPNFSVRIFESIRQLDATLTQDERQAQRLASRWLILYWTSKGWSYESLAEHTGLSLEALKLLAYSAANYDLGTDQQWSTLAALLEDEAHNKDFIMTIILIALGLYQPEDVDLVAHIATDLEAHMDRSETAEKQLVQAQMAIFCDFENISHRQFPGPDQPITRVRILVTEDTEKSKLHTFNYLIDSSRPFGPWYGTKVHQESLPSALQILHELRHITIEDETLYITQHIESNQTSRTEWATNIAETNHIVPYPQLLVFESCNVRPKSTDQQDSWIASIRKTLDGLNIPAVVALRDTVTPSMAQEVFYVFYAELQQGNALRQAVSAARDVLSYPFHWSDLAWYVAESKQEHSSEFTLRDNNRRFVPEHHKSTLSAHPYTSLATVICEELNMDNPFIHIIAEAWLRHLETGTTPNVKRHTLEALVRMLQTSDQQRPPAIQTSDVTLTHTLSDVFASAVDRLVASLDQQKPEERCREVLVLDALQEEITHRRAQLNEPPPSQRNTRSRWSAFRPSRHRRR